MTIRTILVDDEKLAIQGLQLRLQAFDDIEIVATCQNGREAIRKIKTLKPDLVFLDIQMPGFDGFSVVQGVMDIDPPLFVFVTAYSEHAIKAFEADAIDYLMKPVEPERLADTMDRVRTRLTEKRGVEEVERLRHSWQHATDCPSYEPPADFSGLGPLVGSATAPVQELISNGVEGLLAPFWEPESIAASLSTLLEDQGQAARLGKAARKAARGISAEHGLQSWRQLIQETCETSLET